MFLPRKHILFVVLLASFLASRVLWAADTDIAGVDLQFYRPALDRFGFFAVNGPGLLKGGQYSISGSQGLATGSPFQIAVNNVPVNLVGSITTLNLTTAFGITDFFTIGLDVPVHVRASEANFNTLDDFQTRSLGDLALAVKFRLLAEDAHRPGMAMFVENIFPTGDDLKFLGNGHAAQRLDLILGKDFAPLPLRFAANFGVEWHEKKNVLGVNFDDRFGYGAAVQIPIKPLDPTLSFVGELRGHNELNSLAILTSPIEVGGGVRKEFKNGFILQAGAGTTLNNAIGSPQLRQTFTITYAPPPRLQFVTPAVLEVWREHSTVYFDSGRVTPTAESQRVLETLVRHEEIQKAKRLRLEGHTDSVGAHVTNQRLAEERAEKIKAMLVEQGLESDKITTTGYDEDRPAADNRTPTGRRLNRRVEIKTIP